MLKRPPIQTDLDRSMSRAMRIFENEDFSPK